MHHSLALCGSGNSSMRAACCSARVQLRRYCPPVLLRAYWYNADDEAKEKENKPIFNSATTNSKKGHGRRRPAQADVVSVGEARAVIDFADANFKSLGARIEYSKVKGVDYESSVLYMQAVCQLTASMDIIVDELRDQEQD